MCQKQKDSARACRYSLRPYM